MAVFVFQLQHAKEELHLPARALFYVLYRSFVELNLKILRIMLFVHLKAVLRIA
jgi:hypothetical protein